MIGSRESAISWKRKAVQVSDVLFELPVVAFNLCAELNWSCNNKIPSNGGALSIFERILALLSGLAPSKLDGSLFACFGQAGLVRSFHLVAVHPTNELQSPQSVSHSV